MHRSAQPHAKLLAIDTAEAARSEGVVCVLTHEDLPGGKLWSGLATVGGSGDEPVLAFDKVRWKGEPIAAVVAQTLEQAETAAAKVKVKYEPLPAVFDVEEALASGAPNLIAHWPGNHYVFGDDHAAAQLRLGDVETALAEADHVVENTYQTMPIEQAPLETIGCVAVPDGDGRYTVHTGSQSLSTTLKSVAAYLGMPANRLRFVSGSVGGGFGGKVDLAVEVTATLAAMKTERPVKYRYSREEEMYASSTRAAWRVYIKDGVMNDGRIVARKVTTYHDSGAYLRMSNYGSMKHSTHWPGPYTVPNVWVDVYCVFTNRTPSGAMRGFGIMPASFAIEVQMDRVAKAIGMDPWRLRLINAYRNGDMRGHHRAVEDAAMIETIQAMARLSGQELPGDLQSLSSWQEKAD
jgi:CO/xanthine dehydrogenase Mo-binding subunit